MLTATVYKSNLSLFLCSLRNDEMSDKTIITYRLALLRFQRYLSDDNISEISKENILTYKKTLLEYYTLATSRLYILVLNAYLRWIGFGNLCVKPINKGIITNLDKVISLHDYNSLLKCAETLSKRRLYVLIKTLASTGLRIDELRFLTVKTIKSGMITVHLKRKYRVVVIHESLQMTLLSYIREEKIKSGIVFHGRNPEKLIDKSFLWRELKKLAEKAGVDPTRVYAHSFRHFFAKTFISKWNSITDLADILGHANLETTRIYTRTSISEKKEKIAQLGL